MMDKKTVMKENNFEFFSSSLKEKMFLDWNSLLKFFLVENIFAKTRTNTFQVGNIVGIFFD